MKNIKSFRSSIAHFTSSESSSIKYYEDAILITKNGLIEEIIEIQNAPADLVKNSIDYTGKLIIPGLIDSHIHYPQTQMIASYGEKLLEWLDIYTFPEEKKFKDPTHANAVAEIFIRELIKNGTTTAAVYSSVHPQACDKLFEVAKKYNFRLIAGKVMMDRHAPSELLDTAISSYEDSKQLILKWHNQGRASYAVTPRFAPTSTHEQLLMAQKLLQEFPDVYMQTHLSENLDEIKWVKSLFPDCENYLAVYEKYGLVGERSIFGHAIHLEISEVLSMKSNKSIISFCPTSNLFLGSGLFNLDLARQNNIKVAIASDVGAGTSFSLLKTLSDAYKICQLQSIKFSSLDAFHMATLGGAMSLGLDHKIGNFTKGKEADFIVIDASTSPLLAHKFSGHFSIEEKLFSLMILGDDRAIRSTYLMAARQ